MSTQTLVNTTPAKPKLEAFPGFTRITDQIYVHKPQATRDSITPTSGPRVIIIYGWGDGLPRHVSKYTDGFRTLFPNATIIAVLSPIFKALTQSLTARSQNMGQLLDIAYPADATYTASSPEDAVLVHAMSNTGAINYTATIHAYKQRFGRPMPCRLLSHDSMPGSVKLTWENMPRWSRAMALGTAAFFPWPFFVTQGIWGLFLAVNEFGHWIAGAETAPVTAARLTVDEEFTDKNMVKLFMYSKEDEIIYWEDVEAAMAHSLQKGYKVESEIFTGSGHVGHMRQSPEKYWKLIQETWEKATKAE
ncbi:hypothetical protein CFO_g2921 [Ceratocystis platani]|uniref:Transmembrane protein 53 n=1 Tax=Ceratocystis fimbriata f. sp. platani TaxID=88771 RepID=A0A0F8DFF0_CERFI|nr:hypothetical protein CFO_g2921 [Ceratocystis platani]